MKDLHSHFLPNVDDGAHSEEMTLLMLKSALDYGVTDILFTPHYIVDSRYEKTKEENREIFLKIQNVAKFMGINVYYGNEVYCSTEILSLYKAGKIATLNNSRYMLIEIPMNTKMHNIKEIFFELLSHGIVPVLAHPERYTAYYEDYNFFYDLRKMGVLMQINFPSLLGYYGKKAEKMAKMLLKYNLISFVGSDMHSNRDEKYEGIEKATSMIKKIVGEANAKEILENNFLRVIYNQEI